MTEDARESSATSLGDRFDGFVIDLDGVVWVGRAALPGAAEALRTLRARGRRLVYMTNNPSSARVEYATRLRKLGVDADEDDVITAGWATAAYLADHNRVQGRTAYVIGSAALKDEIRAAELRLIEGAAAIAHAELVVVGGHEEFNYDELRIASLAVRRGAALYATGRDATFPMPGGPWPATGAILAAVETASGQRARSLGKPEPFIFELARARLADCARVAVVGDNLEADIHGGRQAGWATILVLTGNASRADIDRSSRTPDYVVDALASLI